MTRARKKRADSVEVEAALRRYERASSEARARADLLEKAVEIIRVAKRGQKMTARRQAAKMVGLSMSGIDRCWQEARRYPKSARAGALLPRYAERPSRLFVPTVPGLQERLSSILIERGGLIGNLTLAKVALADFKLHSRHERAVTDYVRNVKAQCGPEILIATNPDGAMNRLLPAHGSVRASVDNFLDRVEVDGSPCDAFPLERELRARLIVGVDTFSKFKMGIVVPIENADALGLWLFAFQDGAGLPRVLVIDHGAPGKSARFRTFCERMNISVEPVSQPYSGFLKGDVERAVGSSQGWFALEAGFGGHSVAERNCAVDSECLNAVVWTTVTSWEQGSRSLK